MKKVIAAFIILALLLTLGCGGKDAPAAKTSPAVKDQTASVDAPEDTSAAETTAAAISDVETDLDGLEELDESFLSEELDDLDSELDFEI